MAKTIRDRILDALAAQGVSQEDLARRTGLAKQNLNAALRGRRPLPPRYLFLIDLELRVVDDCGDLVPGEVSGGKD